MEDLVGVFIVCKAGVLWWCSMKREGWDRDSSRTAKDWGSTSTLPVAKHVKVTHMNAHTSDHGSH